jgi:hypothetical protein
VSHRRKIKLPPEMESAELFSNVFWPSHLLHPSSRGMGNVNPGSLPRRVVFYRYPQERDMGQDLPNGSSITTPSTQLNPIKIEEVHDMKREIEQLQALLNEELDHLNGEVLKSQLVAAEAWSGWTAQCTATYKRILAEKRGQYMYKDTETKETVDIMKARADRMCAVEQEKYDLYREMLQIIRDRISLGQSLLRNIRSEVEAGIR